METTRRRNARSNPHGPYDGSYAAAARSWRTGTLKTANSTQSHVPYTRRRGGTPSWTPTSKPMVYFEHGNLVPVLLDPDRRKIVIALDPGEIAIAI